MLIAADTAAARLLDDGDVSTDQGQKVTGSRGARAGFFNLGALPKSTSSTGRNLIDLSVLLAAFALAVVVRFDGVVPEQMLAMLAFILPCLVGFQYGCLHLAGVHRTAWRYVSFGDCHLILKALLPATLSFVVARIAGGVLIGSHPSLSYVMAPFSLLGINYALAALGIVGVRALRRLWCDRQRRLQSVAARSELGTVLIGAGDTGALVARLIAEQPHLGIRVVGFVDRDSKKHGLVIHGIPVLGDISVLNSLREVLNIGHGLITIANAPGPEIRTISTQCNQAGLQTRVIPEIGRILNGRESLSEVRDVSVEDILGRESVELDSDRVEQMVFGRSVLVTGAGGSIGSELCRQVGRLRPSHLVLVERSEPALFNIHRELGSKFPELTIAPVVCDITDAQRVCAVLRSHQPSVIFHAAAHKHVPMMELNPGEAIKNNVFGTKILGDAADRAGVDTVVLISSDKAVNPSSVMGATKRCAEIYLQALSVRSTTKFVAVRFGNVLGSAGSVIPIFKEQIAAGGPVTVTDPQMQRYFMTIPEASQLVMQAAAIGQGGEIFVLDMGDPVKIVDLAHDLIHLHGLEPNIDIPVEFVGMRPGEKLFEQLSFDAELMDRTQNSKIFVGRLVAPPWTDVVQGLARLQEVISSDDVQAARDALHVLVPEMLDEDVLVMPLTTERPKIPDSYPTSQGAMPQHRLERGPHPMFSSTA